MKQVDLRAETEIVLKELQNKGFSRDTIEQELGYSANYIDQQLSKGSNNRFLNALKGFNGRVLQKATPTIEVNGYHEKAVYNLSESNKTLADANKIVAEANRLISKNNDELIQLTKMVLNSTALPKNHQEALGPEDNTVSHGFGQVNPSDKQKRSSKDKR
jgi:uncharacterized coiled-coil protein SlyX